MMKALALRPGVAGACGGVPASAETRPQPRPAALIEMTAPPLAAPASARDGPDRRREAQGTPRDPNRGSVTNLPLPRYVSLKGNEGNARRGPGLTHRIDWVFTRAGMPLRITAEFEHWRRVEDSEGVGGWVNFVLLSGVRTALVTQDMAEFRTLPDVAAPVSLPGRDGRRRQDPVAANPTGAACRSTGSAAGSRRPRSGVSSRARLVE